MKTVAIVSAQPLLRLGLQHCLDRSGHAVEVHEFGSSGCFVLREMRVDLILLDARCVSPIVLSSHQESAHRIVLLTDVPAAYLASMVMCYGFAGIIHLDDSAETTCAAIENLLRGGRAVSRRIALPELDVMRKFLPPRSVVLARHAALCSDIRDTAAALKLDHDAAREAKQDMRISLGVSSDREIAGFALRAGIVTLNEFVASIACSQEGRS